MRLVRVLPIVLFAGLLPSVVFAQATITGVVRDTSGAVLPGVTVEAASPVLIEKVRTATSDGSGQYRIIDLRPGAYTLTFSLAGFNTVRRDGVELSGTGVATVNADMRVGALEETITVTGSAPVVDTQSVRQQAVLSRDTVRDIPTSRQYYSVAALVPGVQVTNQTQDVGGSATLSTPDYLIHGGRAGDGRLTVDGLSVGSARASGANRSMYAVNVGVAQETTISTSGGLGEAETAGIAFNVIPREGGNTIRGSWFAGFANGSMQGNNFDDRLRSLGLATPNELQKVWEVTPTIGGPIIKDKLWYLAGARHQGTRNTVGGMFYNKNAGDITKWNYEPDTSRPALDDGTWKSLSLRLTYQASAKNKINVFWDEQDRRVGWLGGGTSVISPEANALQFGHPNRVGQLTWSSPRTNKLLLEAGTSAHQLQWSGKERPGYDRNMIRVTEQAGAIPGIQYRGMTWASNWSGTYQTRASLSYVTGAHSSKVGLLRTMYATDDRAMDPINIAYTFNNGNPVQLTLNNTPRRLNYNHYTTALYAQDSWTVHRLTLQGGVRYDRMTQHWPEQPVGYTKYMPNGFMVPEGEGVKWNDITPRGSAAYNLTGDGKTAVKFSIGKYVVAQDGGGTFGANIVDQNRLAATTVNRAWTDNNHDYVPDCDLLNPLAQSPATTGSIDTCGAYSNSNFGKNVYTNTYDPELIHGWGVRPFDWEMSASIQRELLPKLGVNVGYFRRWYGNFVTTDNRAVGPEDFSQFSITVPTDSRLPDGGGYTVTGFNNVNPNKFGQTDNFITRADKYGKQTEMWQGVDINVVARGYRGLTFSGGTSTGRAVTDDCAVAAKLPETYQSLTTFGVSSNSLFPLQWCHLEQAWLTQFKGLGAYLVPKADVLVSATFQSAPLNQHLSANFVATNAIVQPSLGRPLSGNAANVTVNILEPGQEYGERSNQLDLRFAKVLRFGRSRTNVGIDLYNALNANPITAYNQTYGARWLVPQTIMPARFLKFSAQVDW